MRHCFLISLMLIACHRPYLPSSVTSNLTSKIIQTPQFKLQTYVYLKESDPNWRVYIEGDGRSWLNRYTLSRDPSPLNSGVLKMVTMDLSHNTLYLGRPGQYMRNTLDYKCDAKYWSSARFSDEVIVALSQAIDQSIVNGNKPAKLHLIGYSGGGGLAVLLAAKRSDVVKLTTLAGDLNIDSLSEYHQASKQIESINPIKMARKINKLPQNHFSGAKDNNVPQFMAFEFINELGKNHCANHIVLPNLGHKSQDWYKLWLEIQKIPFKC